MGTSDYVGEYYAYIKGENTYQKIGTLPSSVRITVDTKDDLMTAFDKSYDLCRGTLYSSTEIVKIGEPIDMKDQIRNFEIKKKSTKKGNAIVYSCNFGYGCEDIKYTIEFYEEDFWLAPEAVIALFSIMWKSGTGKLIFRDHKVIAITRNKIMQILKEPDKNGNKTKYGHVSYVANCMDADRYDPYTGALIAISKHVNGNMSGTPNSKSEIKRLYKQIEDFYADFK